MNIAQLTVASWLVLAGAMVILFLGTAHLIYTFRGPKLMPRDSSLISKLESTGMVISNETTMWRAWLGFNASHSLGAMMFASIYGYLAVCQPALLFETGFLGGLGVLVLACYAVLARLYWFSTPFLGILLALVLYLAGFATAFTA